MEKIKLLFILPTLNGGGAEKVVCNLMNSLNKKEFEVNLFLFNNSGVYWDLLDSNIKIILATQNKCNSKIKILKSLYNVSKNMDIIIGSMELMPTYLSIMISKILHKKVIGWIHINIDSILNDKSLLIRILHKKFLLKLFYNQLDKIITVSNGSKESICKYLIPSNKTKVQCIYNPIDISFIKKKSLEPMNENLNKPLVMGIGRLERQKNFALLIKAHKILLDKGIQQNVVILGQGSQYEYLSNMINKFNLTDTVKLLGFKKNPYKYLKQADVFVQSSIYEGLPTVLIEALVLGIPVVATNCPDGAKEILDNGKYGLLVDSNKEKLLADNIEKILSDINLRNKYKIYSKEAITRFEIKHITKIFEQLFLSLYKQKD